MKKNVLLILIIISGLISCDYYYKAEIKNELKIPITLKIKFDSISLHKYWSNKSYMPFLRSYPNFIGIKAIGFDTINLVKTYIIKPDSIFPLESGTSPIDFELFENLTMIGKDTVFLKNKFEIDKAFAIDDNKWRKLKIK